MFVKYSKGKTGIVDYLKYGISKSRDYDREILDERIIVDGELLQLDYILNNYSKKITKNNNGDNYKHFVITFKEQELSIEILKKITFEFKKFAMQGYKANELYFYAEIHYPKLKGYVFKNGEFNYRKPHIHIIIPVYNLYTGTKQYNFNYRLFKYDFYLSLFSKSINFKYNLNSPYEVENKKLLKNHSLQINRKNSNIYISEKLKIKESILKDIVSKNISNTSDLLKLLKITYRLNNPRYGNINPNMLILSQKDKDISLNDFCFHDDFLKLPKEQKNKLFNKYNLKTIDNTIYNSKLTQSEQMHLENYNEYISKKIKYSKTISNFNDFIILSDDEQKKLLELEEQNFYKKVEKNDIRKHINIRNIKSNVNTTKNYDGELNYLIKVQSEHINNITSVKYSRRKIIEINRFINTIPLPIIYKILEIKYGIIKLYNSKNESNIKLLQENINDLVDFNKLKIDLFKNKEIILKLNPILINKISNFYSEDQNSNEILNEFLDWKNLSKVKKLEKFKINMYDEYTNKYEKEKEKIYQQYLIEKLKIENKYINLSKICKKELIKLKLTYNLNIKRIETHKKKYLQVSLRMKKENINNGTIVGNDYLNFIKDYFRNNNSNSQEILNYVNLVEILSNEKNNGLTISLKDKSIKIKKSLDMEELS